MEKSGKARIYLASLLILSGILWSQMLLGWFEETKLHGSYELKENTDFTINDWISEQYQKRKSEYLNDHVAFRPALVSIHNQLLFSLFKKSSVLNLIIGKQNYLYEKGYIDGYNGNDYLGQEKIVQKVKKLKILSDTLQNHGSKLIVVLAPGKARYYPEFIPDYLQKDSKTTNYTGLIEEFSKQNIAFVDFNPWFLSMKKTSKYPLYPQTGIHWSSYATTLVIDSLSKYISSLYQEHAPQFIYSDFTYDNSIRDSTDVDIQSSLNLFQDIRSMKLAYRDVDIKFSKDKNNCIFISDSYGWTLYNSGLTKKLFNEFELWYYFKQLYKNHETPVDLDYSYVYKKLNTPELVVIMSTEMNYNRFDFGFSENILEMFQGKLATREKRIKEIMISMENSSEWMEALKLKAQDQNRTLAQVMKSDAEWMYDQEK